MTFFSAQRLKHHGLRLAMLLVSSLCVMGLAPQAGTRLQNQATVTFLNTSNGLHETLQSNVVAVLVLPQEALTLTQSQTLSRTVGARVVLPHRVANTGNTPITVILEYANLGDDTFDINALTLVQDLNSNGLADAGEPVVPSGGTIFLAPGAFLNLLLTGNVPGAVAPGQRALLLLSAKSQGQGVVATNTDTVVTIAGATLELVKSASSLTPQRQDAVTFTLIGRNIGGSEATGIAVTVDGTTASYVVLRDIVPANMTLVRLEPPQVAQTLYHRLGDPVHMYTARPPNDLTQVDAVALGFPTAPVGFQGQLRFTATVHANASGPIKNTGTVDYTDTTGSVSTNSNTVELTTPLVAPTLAYYTNGGFTTLAPLLHLGSPLFVQADAAACNESPTRVENRVITITSTLTGDVESFSATESTANSGLFRILPPPATVDAAGQPGRRGNGLIETVKNDTLTAQISGCGASVVNATILVDPFGVVLDSKTNVPVAGVRITLIDVTGAGNGGNAGGPAVVLQLDTTPTLSTAQRAGLGTATRQVEGTIPAPSTVVTGGDGQFAFPLVAPSTYRLVVEPPNDYAFPSVLPPALLPPNRTIDASGSYGGAFAVGPSLAPVQIDIPVDRTGTGGLLIDKQASQRVVDLGDFVDYTVKVQNTRDAAVAGVRLTDRLPAGFALQRGTVRLNKARIVDPEGAPGPGLLFALGSIPAQGSVTLTYRVRVGPGALQGDGVNRATAVSAPPLPQTSNVATVKVEVRGGVFSDKGFILGKVFVDCNQNRVQDAGELGIPGVRLYLEDGTFAISDPQGQFSFAGITPRTHVVKLDTTTLPSGATLVPLANRHARDPKSRFVDLKSRELHRADFAEGSCSEQVLEEVRSRRSQHTLFRDEAEKSLAVELSPDPRTQAQRDPRTLPASGLVATKDTVPSFSPVVPLQRPDARNSSLPNLPVQTAPSVELADLLPTLDATLGFLDLQDGDTLPIAQTNVRIKGPADSNFTLVVNGSEVPASRVGTKSKLPTTGVEAWEYIGVNLVPGTNTLEVIQRDLFNIVRGRQSLTVMAPDKLGRVKMLVDHARPVADGRTPIQVTVRLEDAAGVPVTVRTPVTLEASRGQWQEPDLNPHEPGLQAFITGGSATFALLPPSEAGDALLRVSSGALQGEVLVPFFPDLRPLIAAGVVEGILNVNKLNPNALVPTRKQDGFEQELRALAFSADKGKVQGAARTALFLKGKIQGDYLLTLAYDSDKNTKERLFRDIQPDEFYPVYGDSSIHGFDAQSTDKLYVRVDKDKSYLLYGDLTAETRNPASNLGHYNRSLTGGKLHYENHRVSAEVFASRDNTRQVVDDIPGRGISGPYQLSTSNIRENSEKVEIQTRDRNQPSVVLETVPKARFTDYEVDALGGTLVFREPVRSVDQNLNPIVIRVVYEVEQGSKDFWTYGVAGQVKITDFFQVGGTYAREDNPQDRYEIASLNALVKLSDGTYMLGEIARTDRDSLGEGLGWRAELVHDGNRLKARLYIGRTEGRFDNPTALLGKGRFEANAKATYDLDPRTKLIGEVLHTEDTTTNGNRQGIQGSVARQLGSGLVGEVGLRHSRETGTPADRPSQSATPYESTSVRARLGAQVPFLPQLNVFTEYEQDVVHSDRRIVALGGEYQLLNRSRIYAKHEFLSSLRGPFTLNSLQKQHNTVVGVDVDYLQDGHVFSEYRMDNGLDGRETQAAIGVRHGFRITNDLRLQAGFERVQTMEGKAGDSTSLTGAVEYLASSRLKATARLELRDSDSGDSLLHTLGLGYKFSDDWTFLGKHALALSNKGAKERVRLGVAYRDTATNLWHALLRYEWKLDTEDGVRRAHILSATANYQPVQSLTLSGTAAAKWLTDHSHGYRDTSSTYLLSSRVTYDLTKDWDVGLTNSALFSGGLASVQYGLGVEVGRVVAKNLWLSVGYNIFGFRDDDLIGVDYTNRGVFLRFRYKFDEDLLHDATEVVSQVFGGGKAK